ncbi:MAG: hypothetical protein methR_P1875 [Methyloprofundus sp.]|nr:MAG: hypothetical protein methR_P1875 [Methyloprofundus sp.]
MINERRNAETSIDDFFGDSAKQIVYLDQNWDRYDSLWFYNTTQGSDLIPYSIFINLEQAGSTELFRSSGNMRKLRFLTQEPSFDNPDGLPVGFVKDSYQGKDYMGFTCAACHTTQVNYNGIGIRIDGAPALSDIESLLLNMTSAIEATLTDSKKLARLTNTIVALGDTENKQTFKGELKEILVERQRYNTRNAPTHNNINVPYGYGRLDAFGRIYNRILSHLVKPEIDNTSPANAPVSYPTLWDTPYSDFVQWNGVGDNKPRGRKGFLGPLNRNTGEVLGVFATFDLQKKGDKGFISSAVTRNLNRLESQLKSLESPLWPEDILPKINQPLASKGRKVFLQYQCDACHMDPEKFDRTSPDRFMKSEHTSLELIGTDRTMALNALRETNNIGSFKGLGLFQETTLVLPLLQYAVDEVILEPDHDTWFTRRWPEQAADFLFAEYDNPLKVNTQRYVDFEVIPDDDPVKKIVSLRAYRGRSLNGIWATAPYLHNGSVPNLYELFLPKCSKEKVVTGKQCRSKQFTVGSREFDPKKVGFISKNKDQYPNLYNFDTSLPSNSNAGHEYAVGITRMVKRNDQGVAVRDKNNELQLLEPFPVINEGQRMALVEYLKTL